MAGPTCTILHSNSVVADNVVAKLIRLVAVTQDVDSIYVADTCKIDGFYKGSGRPFLFFSELQDTIVTIELASALGYESISSVGLAAMCSGAEDHRILAEMALWLAERLSGYVDMNGKLPFPSNLPGKIFALPYDTINRQAQYQVIDAIALRFWLSCPDFRMVK
jgi:hypothetical protein